MSIDQILKSAGEDRAEMDSMVSQHREMSAAYEMVLADHWDVEDLLCTIEDLASRLQGIRAAAASHLTEDGVLGDLARTVEEIALPTAPAASELLRAHLGLTDPTPSGNKLMLFDKSIYGHPGLRFATHGEFRLDHGAFVYSSYLVNPSTGAIEPVRQDETAEEAILRVGSAMR